MNDASGLLLHCEAYPSKAKCYHAGTSARILKARTANRLAPASCGAYRRATLIILPGSVVRAGLYHNAERRAIMLT
ncbi:MAG: hypothetical protein ACPLQP_10305, partial [Moorellaceae bacterium]